jgi:hypothetical protein
MRSQEMCPQNLETKFPMTPIEYPKTNERVTSLQEKLKEYKERLNSLNKNQQVNDAPIPPEEINGWLTDTRNKIAILEKLLTEGLLKGGVDGEQMSREMAEKDENFDVKGFMEDFFTIDDYVKTGGRNIGGGTGLK